MQKYDGASYSNLPCFEIIIEIFVVVVWTFRTKFNEVLCDIRMGKSQESTNEKL